MRLVEQHIIKRDHIDYGKVDHLCFLSKNVYNSSLYHVKTTHQEQDVWFNYFSLEKKFKEINQKDYRALPIQSSQQIMKLLFQNITSYFKAIEKWKKNPKDFLGMPRFPMYKDSEKGRCPLIFTYQQLGLTKDGEIRMPKMLGLSPIKTNVIDIKSVKQVRVTQRTGFYLLEVVYEVPDVDLIKNDNRAAIDLGVNNLAALTFNNTNESYLFNGKPLKSINCYYHKKMSDLKSQLEIKNKKKSSKRTRRLCLKHRNKVKDYIHKTTREITNKLQENNISKIAIGYNKGWKQKINIGKVNNQNFVSIPYDMVISQLKYKCALKGIEVITIKESYTSLCSALDREEIKPHKKYQGNRVKRGLFHVINMDLYLNADVNSSLNIGRNAFGDGYVDIHVDTTQTGIGCGQHPKKLNLNNSSL